jgi:hypothetical protein
VNLYKSRKKTATYRRRNNKPNNTKTQNTQKKTTYKARKQTLKKYLKT